MAWALLRGHFPGCYDANSLERDFKNRMRFRLAVLAEFAQHTQSGALNVLGMFEHLWFERFPNDYLFFVVLIRVQVGEYMSTHFIKKFSSVVTH